MEEIFGEIRELLVDGKWKKFIYRNVVVKGKPEAPEQTRPVGSAELSLLAAKADKMIEGIMQNREKILKAFMAETGLKPSECEQVVEGTKWFVRKRS